MTSPTLALPSGFTLPRAARILVDGKAQLEARAANKTLQLTAALMAGDHWAAGAGWVGPLPMEASAEAAKIGLEIQRTFVSRNLMRDVVERHRNGIAGREPLWTLPPRRIAAPDDKPTAAEAARGAEYSGALTGWWENTSVWLDIHHALDLALWSERGYLRLYIPDDALDDLGPDGQGRPQRGIPAGQTLEQVMNRIRVHAPLHGQATVTRTGDGRETGAVYAWTDAAKRTHYEVQELERGRVIVHPDLLPAGTDALPPTEYPLGAMLMHEIQLPAIVTDSIRRLNLMLNKTFTMGSRNIDLGAFTETTILNAQMPRGEWVPDPGAPGGKVWQKARPHMTGPGVRNYISGLPIMREDPETGRQVVAGIATPSIDHRDPTPFTVFSDTAYAAREMIYDEARQLHVLITGDAAANGVSRQQAVNDFMSSLEPTRIALEKALRWLLGTVLDLALYLAGRAGEAADYRVRVQARASAVQPTAAEVESALKLHQEGAISEETFYARIGVEDVDAERAARQREGITPTIALRILDRAPVAWIGVRALQLAFPALGISDADVQAQREVDLSGPTGPDLTDPLTDPPTGPNALPNA